MSHGTPAFRSASGKRRRGGLRLGTVAAPGPPKPSRRKGGGNGQAKGGGTPPKPLTDVDQRVLALLSSTPVRPRDLLAQLGDVPQSRLTSSLYKMQGRNVIRKAQGGWVRA